MKNNDNFRRIGLIYKAKALDELCLVLNQVLKEI